MKKLILLLLFIPFVFSCSKEEFGSENESQIEKKLSNKWFVIKLEEYWNDNLDSVWEAKQVEVNGCRSYWNFNEDYNWTNVTTFVDCSGFDGISDGDWELLGSNIIKLKSSDPEFNGDYEIVEITESKLTLKSHQICGDGCDQYIWFLEK